MSTDITKYFVKPFCQMVHLAEDVEQKSNHEYIRIRPLNRKFADDNLLT